MSIKSTAIINQAIIEFCYLDNEFITDQQLEGIKPDGKIHNALDAHYFCTVYDCNLSRLNAVPVEQLQSELPYWFRQQAI